jgi:hypothetical protein
MGRFVRMPSPSMVVACIALLVALGGVGVAATKLPSNSVGTTQLKANAVTSLKVKIGSLRRVDFKAGQLTAGAAGPAGPKGDTGDIGPSDGFSRSVVGPVNLPTTVATTVASLSLQPGKYVIWAKTYIDPTTGTSVVGCDLRAGDDADISYATVFSGPWPATIALTVVHEYGAAGTADLVCTAAGTAGKANRARVTAIKVAKLTTSSG